MLSVVPAQCLGYTAKKNFWTRELGLVVIQLYAGECTPSVDRFLRSVYTGRKAKKSNTE